MLLGINAPPLPKIGINGNYRLKKRSDLTTSIENYKNKFKDSVPRPQHWSGWILSPSSIEFWLDGDNRIHERLKYILDKNNNWIKSLLSP